VPGLAAVAVIAAFDARTTGDWKTTPWQLYSRQYAPIDGPGLGQPPHAPAPLSRPEHLRPMFEGFERGRRAYTWAGLPHAAAGRLEALVEMLPFRALALLALLAPLSMPSALFAAAWLGVLFLLQLTFHYSVPQYHIDELAPLLVLIASGLQQAIAGVRRPRLALAALIGLQLVFYPALYRSAAAPAVVLLIAALAAAWLSIRAPGQAPFATAAVAGAMAVAAIVLLPSSALRAHELWQRGQETRQRFASLLEELKSRRALLFVHGTPDQMLELPLDATGEPVVAVDLGDRDAALIALHPDREPLRLDASAWKLSSLRPAQVLH
jgi:hypothetical protein